MDPTSRGGQGDAHGGAGHGHSHGHAHGHDHGHGHGHGHAHGHAHAHDHGHAHGKAPASIPSRPAGLDRATAFSSSAALRMAVAGGASVLLWAAVWWALAR